MELFKLTDNELTKLCSLQEHVTDCIIPDILSMVNIPITGDLHEAIKNSLEETAPLIIPQIELISYYISPIFEMEHEMNKRGILDEYRKQHPFIDYYNCNMLIYNTYEERLSHLFKMNTEGVLTQEKIAKAVDHIHNSYQNGNGLIC